MNNWPQGVFFFPAELRIHSESSCLSVMHSVNEQLGHDVELFVHDIRHCQKTGRKQETTWAEGKTKEERRRMQNTVGYTFSESDTMDFDLSH